jgi:hypothetical protein
MLRKIAENVIKYRYIHVIITLALTAIFFSLIYTGVMLNDPDDWSNQKHPYVKLNKRILHEFGGANVLQMMIRVKNGGKYKDIFNLDTLARIKQISDGLLIMKGFIPPNFEGLAASKVKYFKATKEMITIEQLMAETPRTQEAIDRVKEGVMLNPLVFGKLVSKDFKATLIMADFNRDITLREIYEAAQKIKKDYSDANHEIMIAGKPVQMGWLDEKQRTEMPWAFLCLFCMQGLIHYLSFFTFRGVVLPLGVGFCGSVIGLGSVALTGVPFNIISYGAPFIILAAGAAHTIQFLKRYQETYGDIRDTNESIIQANVHIMPPLVVSVICDALGFVIILFTPFQNLKNLAIGSTVGLMSLLYLVIFSVPAVTSLLKPPTEFAIAMTRKESGKAHKSFLGKILGAGAGFSFGPWRWRLLTPIILFGIFATWFLFKYMYVGGFDWDTAIYSNLNYGWKKVWVFKDQEAISKQFSGCYPYNILIEGKEKDVGKDPAFLHQVEKLQDWLETRPEITYTISLPNYLRGMNVLFHEGDQAYNHVADDPLLNAQYLYMLSSGSPGEFETTEDTVTWKDAALKTLASCGNPRCYDKLVEDTHKWVDKNWTYPKAVPLVAGGFIGVSASMSEDAQGWLWPVCAALTFLIYLVCAVLFRDWIIPVYLIVPLLYMMVIMLGLGQYFTMSGKDVLDYNAQQFISLCLGVGVDANVYLLFRYYEEYALTKNMQKAIENAWTSTGKAVLFSGLALSIAYIPLFFTNTFWAYLGLGSFEMLMLNLLGSLYLLPLLLGVFRPKFLHSEEVVRRMHISHD